MAQFTSFSGRTRHLAGNNARNAEFNEIPTISLAASEEDIIAQLRDACTRVGFFYVKDHGVSPKVIDGIFQTAKDFFDQSLETKAEIHHKKSKILRGYEPMAEVRTDKSKRADLNEAFICGYEPDLDPDFDETAPVSKNDVATPMQGPNAWPSMEGFQAGVSAYYGEVLRLARRMVRLFAKVLDLPEEFFDSTVVHPGAMLRLLKYPAQDPDQPDALGIGAHTDIEAFTILCQGAQPALQILNVDGQWIQAPPVPGTFVVNIGDMLARWSNDVFISTVHRVHNGTGCERFSIPFFFGPSYDTVLNPLSTCVPEGEKAGYEPIVAGEYVWQRLARSRLSKQGAESKSFLQSSAVA
ncbi:isopenicillin n [Lecanosticta acicola]|uniref:Isopenicillin n n=1 Tax=Lecanosticta acicola TaxID=111012 RepID=A0AAI9EF36_9PEZI|nr:isopenicillin n [Lecanosticta acicola]